MTPWVILWENHIVDGLQCYLFSTGNAGLASWELICYIIPVPLWWCQFILDYIYYWAFQCFCWKQGGGKWCFLPMSGYSTSPNDRNVWVKKLKADPWGSITAVLCACRGICLPLPNDRPAFNCSYQREAKGILTWKISLTLPKIIF